jgi:hypothetical protein
MIKIYVIWQYCPIRRKEIIKGWDRNKKQAYLKKPHSLNESRIEEKLITKETLKDIRKARLAAIELTIKDLPSIIKQTKIKKENSLLVRSELVTRKLVAERMMLAEGEYIFEEEVEFILHAAEEGLV